ncbi:MULTISPECIES: hypothetical protein [unclassified Saccharothrix]|uniref:hypothetical protein n=1 Tax=unclassified Saccharothrix TaxID=2593673 RepID=UPI00307D3F8B
MIPWFDPRVARIPVAEVGEPLADLGRVEALRVAPWRSDPVRLRVSVLDRLVLAQTLLPRELRFLVLRGYGPVALHVSGAAVDLTLCSVDGSELWMGTEVEGSTDEVRERRRVLTAALTGAGLVNYPAGWWHWSYGDRYWAWVTGAPAARYGPVPG